MAKQTCYDCVYSYWDGSRGLMNFPFGFPSWPACANQPDCPGQMRPVPLGGVCRNYRRRPKTPGLADGTVKRIPLSDGLYAYVDAADYEWLSRHNWFCYGGYATRSENGKRIYMHREIMQPPKGMVVDHIDGNRLNNCRVNMRNCTPRENGYNRAKKAGSSCRFKGVCRDKRTGRYVARTWLDHEPVYLGVHDDEIKAARAYDRGVVELGIECARLNFPEEWPAARRGRVRAQWLKAAAKHKQKGKKRKAKDKRGKGHAKRAGRS